jgi:hypothetical protein
MHEPSSILRLEYQALLASRSLPSPDGQPLYAYGFSRDEFEAMAQALRTVGPRFLYDGCGRALFVAYTAEWFRRVREGGHWDWIHPLQSLNVRYHATDDRAQVHYADVRAAADAGLTTWRRPPRRGLSTLHAVIAESGFPAAAARQGPRLANWLRRSVLAIEAGFAPEDAVSTEAWRAPESLVDTLFEAATSLCRAIVELRTSVSDGPSGLDTVQRLDRVRSNWREDLPFNLEEQDVRRLVEELVRAERDLTRGLEVVRRLRRTERGWTAFAELLLNGGLDNRRLPAELLMAVDRSTRIRLRPAGALAEFGRVVTALERVVDEEQDRWELRPLVQSCDLRLALDQDFRLQAIAGEAVLTEFTAFTGDPLEGPAIALEPPTGTNIDQLEELLVLGASPARTQEHWIVLAVVPSALERLHIEGERRDLGEMEGGSRVLVAFDGRAELEIGGERFVWRAGDERREALRLNLVGDTVRQIEGRVFCGCPSAWVSDDETAALVMRRELTWRALASHEWTAVTEREPLGKVELAVRRKGVLIAWTRAQIVPPGFRMDADAKSRTLRLTGIAGGAVAAHGSKPLPCRAAADTAVIDLADHPRGAMLRLRLHWANTVEMCLPDPVTEPVLLDPSGRPSTTPRLAVGRLSGYRLLAPSPWTLLFELRSTGLSPAYAMRAVDGLVPLASFGELIRQLLGGCEDLDACVRLSWTGREGRVAEIGWYDLDQPLNLPESSSPFAALANASAAPTLVAFSLVLPQAGTAHLSLAPAPVIRSSLTETLGEGPWLLSGSTQEGRRLRPRVLDGSATSPLHNRLLTAQRESSRERRDAALDSSLGDAALLTVEELRHFVELAKVAASADVPFASVDGLRALARMPKAAVFVLTECASFVEREAVLRLQSELPVLWCASAIEDWIAAFSARRSRLVAKLAAIGEAAELADAPVALALGEILNLQPALRVHVQTALFLSGAGSANQTGLAERLGRPTTGSVESLAQDLVRRHGGGAEPPRSLGLTALLPRSAGFWTRYDPAFADILAAPLAAARIAMGEIAPGAALTACRSAWLFDRDYFESTVVAVLFERAHS